MAEWREEDHPRKDDGEFTKKLNAALDKSSDELRNEQHREIPERPKAVVIDAATGEPKTNAFKTKAEAREYFKDYATKWEQGLSADEVEAVKGYTDRTYDIINTYLRNSKEAKYFKSFNQEKIEKQIRGIDSAISRFELDKDITTYRGTNLLEFGRDVYTEDDLKQLIGKDIVLKGYTSTSTDMSVANEDFDGEVIMECNIPHEKGVGAYMDYITEINNVPEERRESEFMLKRNTQIVINEVSTRQDGKIIVKVRVK